MKHTLFTQVSIVDNCADCYQASDAGSLSFSDVYNCCTEPRCVVTALFRSGFLENNYNFFVPFSTFTARDGDMLEFPLKTFVEEISTGAILIVTGLDGILFFSKAQAHVTQVYLHYYCSLSRTISIKVRPTPLVPAYLLRAW